MFCLSSVMYRTQLACLDCKCFWHAKVQILIKTRTFIKIFETRKCRVVQDNTITKARFLVYIDNFLYNLYDRCSERVVFLRSKNKPHVRSEVNFWVIQLWMADVLTAFN